VVYANRAGEIVINNIDTRLTWMPGVRPVIIPKRQPRRMASRISMNINEKFYLDL